MHYHVDQKLSDPNSPSHTSLHLYLIEFISKKVEGKTLDQPYFPTTSAPFNPDTP